jgi:predicted phosphohydrolase
MGDELDFRSDVEGVLKRLVWSTDLHLDAADKSQYRMFFDLVAEHEPDFVLIGGDISNGAASFNHLTELARIIKKPFYYVLGNHDFYYGSILRIREQADRLAEQYPSVIYLTSSGVIALSKHTALIGHDGWADGRAGDFLHSDIMLNDYFLIEELKQLSQEKRLQKLNDLGLEAAKHFREQLMTAFRNYERVILLTHVPPFAEACLYEGRPSDINWLPHFVCQVAGEVIEDVMTRYPSKELLVLCGHSHWGADVNILPNLRVVTGHSELGIPNVQRLIFIN